MVVWLVREHILALVFQLPDKTVPYFSTEHFIFISVPFRRLGYAFPSNYAFLAGQPILVFPWSS